MIHRTKTGKYCIVARVRIGGKIISKQDTLSCTREQAKARHEQLKAEIRSGAPENRSLIDSRKISTFGELLSLYKDYLSKCGKLSISHEKKIDRIKTELGMCPLNSFVDRFEAWLEIERHIVRNKHGEAIPGRKASPAKVNRTIEIVKAAFNVGLKLKVVKTNPIDKIRFPKVKQIAKDAYLSPEQIDSLLGIVESERPHILSIVKFALQVPCRKNELVNAKIGDLDLINNVIRIRNGESKNDEGNYKPIPPNMLSYFRNLPKDTEYLFFRRDEDGICRPLGNFRRAYKYCLKKAKITGITFHSTRHISATNMIDRGTPEQVVLTVANWKTNMLRDYYHREPKKALGLIQWETPGIGHCEGIVKASGGQNV